MSSAAFTVLVPVLFVVLLGYAAVRAKAFDVDQVAGINELALDFALPASLFVGIVTSLVRLHLVCLCSSRACCSPHTHSN